MYKHILNNINIHIYILFINFNLYYMEIKLYGNK